MQKASFRAGVLGGLAVTPLLVLSSVAPAWGASAAPPGNNGTIKVDGVAFDQGHDNEPHPGCTFRITFFGFDAGTDHAVVTFDGIAPTTSKQLLQDPNVTFTATRDHGGATYDGAAGPYDLTSALAGLSPSKQGYHVKVSVSVDGGNAKHKVFWLSPCTPAAPAAVAPAAVPAAPEAPAATPTVAAASIGSTSAAVPMAPAATTTSDVAEEIPVIGTVDAGVPAEVLGETITRQPATDAAVQSASASRRAGALAFTGFSLLAWSLAGLAALAVGLLLRWRGRARQTA